MMKGEYSRLCDRELIKWKLYGRQDIRYNLYVPTTEEIGILPIPEEIHTSSGMAGYVPALDRDQQHWFLAEKQGTCKPILPIHTSAEKELFRELITTIPPLVCNQGSLGGEMQ